MFFENGKYLSNRELRRRQQEQKMLEKQKQNDTKPKDNEMSKDEVIQAIANIPGVTVVKQETPSNTSNNNDEDFNANDTLKLILEIQCSILAFIRKLKENNNF
jgi:hypothetical protein